MGITIKCVIITFVFINTITLQKIILYVFDFPPPLRDQILLKLYTWNFLNKIPPPPTKKKKIHEWQMNCFPNLFNRPGVAGAVLQTPLWLSDKFIQSSFPSKSSTHHYSQTVRAGEFTFWENVHPTPHVTYPVSHAICHMSHVKCYNYF